MLEKHVHFHMVLDRVSKTNEIFELKPIQIGILLQKLHSTPILPSHGRFDNRRTEKI